MIRKFSIAHQTSLIGVEASLSTRDSQTDSVSKQDNKDSGMTSSRSTESSRPFGYDGEELRQTAENLNNFTDCENSTDEGLSVSEDDDHQQADERELNGLLKHLDLDHRLINAAHKGDSELVKELLCSSAKIITDESGTTALHVAAQKGFADILRILVEHGAEVDTPDSGGYTALHKAAANGHLDVLELLINEGCAIDTQDDVYGNTPLHEAAWKGYSKSVDILLKNKSNAFITNRAGCTALHLAAQSGHNQSGRMLLYAGCVADLKNNYGDTPLHTASRYGHAGIARILVSAKCLVSEQNKNGDTALHIAAAFRRKKIAKLLVEAGINTGIRNQQEETAIDIAQRKGNSQITEIILEMQQTRHIQSPLPTQPFIEAVVNPTTTTAQQDKGKEEKKKTSFIARLKRWFGKPDKPPAVVAEKPSVPQPNELNDGEFFNQYVRKSGFAYYRDLAGNIRQGPVGYVPAYEADSSPDAAAILSAPTKPWQDSTENDLVTGRQKSAPVVGRAAKATALGNLPLGPMPSEAKFDFQHRREVYRHLSQTSGEKSSRTDLHTWLATQSSDVKDNPFAYAVGGQQARFGDDFDQDRLTKYELTEQFPPPPRLFRSRSDETLSHSEFSYHGRAYKSREAAMQELQILKHHEEMRERRKRLRSGAPDSFSNQTLQTTKCTGQPGPIHQSSVPPRSRLPMKTDTNLSASLNRIPKESLGHQAERFNPQLSASQHIYINLQAQEARDRFSGRLVRDEHDAVTKRQENMNLPLNKPRPATMQMDTRGQSNHPEQTVSHNQSVVLRGRQDTHVSPSIAHIKNEKSASSKHAQGQQDSAVGSIFISSNSTLNAPARQKVAQPEYEPNMISKQNEKYSPCLQESLRGQNHNSSCELISPDQYQNAVPRGERHVGQGAGISESSSTLRAPKPNPIAAQPFPIRKSVTAPVSTNDITQPSIRRALPSYEDSLRNKSQTVINGETKTPLSNVTIGNLNNGPVLQGPNVPQLTPISTTSESCDSSNPDSGYGGQNYHFYASQPTKQNTAPSQSVTAFDSWYDRRLQDAARKMTTYGRVRYTMTSDV